MFSRLRSIFRIGAGLILLMLGIIGLVVPIMQGWLLILIAIPLINPEHGKKMAVWVREKWRKRKITNNE